MSEPTQHPVELYQEIDHAIAQLRKVERRAIAMDPKSQLTARTRRAIRLLARAEEELKTSVDRELKPETTS